MANNIIQIRRSSSNSVVTGLNQGELAYTANGDILFIGSPNGSVISIGGARFPGTLTANQALVANSTSGINRISVANLDVVIINATGNVTLSGSNTYITSNTIINGTTTTIGSNVVVSSANIDATSALLRIRDLTVSGNLNVTGTVTTIDVATLTVNDNIIEVGRNNTTTDAVDTGFYSPAGNSTAIWYSGIARIAAASSNTNPVFKVFASNTNPNTSSTIDTSSNTTTGSLQAYLIPYGTGGAFVANSTAVNITANSTVSSALVVNSLTLTTALGVAYGGSGITSYTAGDMIYASGTTTLSKLNIGSNGHVLQVINNLPAFGVLDGGTF